MKVSYCGFAGKNHSWSIVAQNISRQLLKLNHNVHIKSTNGFEYFPNDLKSSLVENLDSNYDMQFSYTAMINFKQYLSHGNSNRFGIWCYEFTKLPEGFAKSYKSCDKILAPSNFAKEIFVNNGVPENHIEVLPHGVNFDLFNKIKYPLKTNKTNKILSVIGQPHIRKNIPGMLDAYGKAFTKKDDVCWVIKIVDKKPESPFEVSFSKELNKFKSKYPNHAEIEVISNFVDNIEELHNSCEIFFSTSNAECFLIPALNALLSKQVIVCSNYGGQLDFLNFENSLLVNGKMGIAPLQAQYWKPQNFNKMFYPDLDDTVEKLREAVYNKEKYKSKLENVESLLSTYSWEAVTKKMLSFVK